MSLLAMNSKKIRILGITILFLIMTLVFGPAIVADSHSYLNGENVRAVFYPMFLVFNQKIGNLLGLENYLWLVIVEQNILSVVAICLLGECWIAKWKIGNNMAYLVYACLVGIWFWELLMDHRWASNAIYTEGICFPLYYLCIFFLLRYWHLRKFRWLIGICFSLFIMILCRKAVLVFAPCFALAVLVIEEKWNRKLWGLIGIFTVMILLLPPLTNCYDKYWNNQESLSNYDANLLANFLYFGEYEDIELLDDDEALVYEYVYHHLEKGEYLFRIQSQQYSGFELTYQRSKKYDYASFELINIEDLNSIVSYFSEKYQMNSEQAVLYMKNTCQSLEMKIIKNHFASFAIAYIMRGMEGLIRTVFLDLKLIRVGALFLYVLWGAMIVKNRKNKALTKWSICLFMIMLINSFGVAVFIFPTYRYMIYNMGLFYLTIVTCLNNKFCH